MINNDRIVPVTATDLLSLYGLILAQDSNNSGLIALDADEIGEFVVDDNSVIALASEPLKKCDIDATASSVNACTIYFVPAYDYEGFFIDGTSVSTAGATVNADGRTLYKATLATGTITIAKVGF